MCVVLTCADDGAQVLAPTAVANQPQRITEGSVGELVAGATTAGVAVVAPIRPDLVVVDLDGCAEVVLPRLLDAADAVAAEVVYLASSGSADSVHAIFAARCDAGRAALLDAIVRLREWAGCDARAVDVVDGGRGLRLPGSASFKPGGGACVPVDVDGTPLTPAAAVSRARAALRATKHPLTYQACRLTGVRQTAQVASRDRALPALANGTRAWRRRVPLTGADQAVLDRSPQRGERSEAACAGAWVLWCHGVRDWAEADTFYDRPVFAKYRTRTDGGRSHWERQASQWASYRAPVTPADQSVIDDWLAAGAHWTDGAAQAALVAVLQIFGDGRGLVARPIACRDLGLLLGCSPSTAIRRLHALRDSGVVQQVRGWQDGPSQEAALYTLWEVPKQQQKGAPGCYRGVLIHDTDTPTGPPPLNASTLHPTWQALGHTCRRLWDLLPHRLPTAALQALTHLPRGDHSYGLLHHLHRLVAAGLLRRTGHGRATSWERTPTSLDAAATQLGVADRARQLGVVLAAERAVWHADSAPARAHATTRLTVLRDRLRTRPHPPRLDDRRRVDDLDTELTALLTEPDTTKRRRGPMCHSGRPAQRIPIQPPRLRLPSGGTPAQSPRDQPQPAAMSRLLAHLYTRRRHRGSTTRSRAREPDGPG